MGKGSAGVMTTERMLWGGRFAAGPDPDLLRMTSSIAVDMRLLRYDLLATRAHARVLYKAGLLTHEHVDALDAVCDSVLAETEEGRLLPLPQDEDVHSFVERLLTERLGETGERIHAGRSRNDLVATDLRLWCRDRARELKEAVVGLIEVICDLAERHDATVMPGYTHLQRAQPISLAFHLAGHGFALARDAARFQAASRAADVSALGAGALAGTTLSLDPHVAASELGFSEVFDNAMDAVSDRDFVCDLAYACALCGVHLSRIAEEIVLWTSAEFGFARLADEWSTGSSMMPQKRNPDLAELVRGRAAGGIADLTGLLTLLKALPLAYDRDLQEDKAFVFGTVDRALIGLEAATRLLQALAFDADRLQDAAQRSFGWATDAAEELVAQGVPFRQAHEMTGKLIAALETDRSDQPRDPRQGVTARQSHGGTAPERVREQIARLRALAEELVASP